MVTLYFWWSNIKGVPESSHKALRIMQITTVMLVILLIWAPITLLFHPSKLPPLPTPANLHLTKESLGWFSGTIFSQISFVVILVAIGHSLLAMSGFETLAQVYREVAYPKMKNLRITANIVCTYAVICTGVVSVLAVMIIPDSSRSMYYDNMIGGLVMNLVGPNLLKLELPRFRSDRGCADSRGRREYLADRSERRAESRCRGWRAARLVPQAP